jgi:hypothetical protein
MCSLRWWVCGVFAVMWAAGPIGAADIYVRAGAEGDGSSKDSPMPYLWKALDKAVRGDVIHVAAGVYEGKGGCGSFLAKVPNLTIAGGYSPDFSQRNPFKHFTILQRAKDYKGGATGLPDGILEGATGSDHSGLIVDGLVLNSASRNAYTASKIQAKESWNGCLLKVNAKDIKIRNCILLNPYGEGIYGTWAGKDNEIANCFIVNTFREGISTRSAQEGSKVTIRNCTIPFCWFQPGKGGGIGVFVGRLGQTVVQDCVIAFMQTEGGEEGNAVNNTFGNDNTILKANIFFQCQGGYYKYMDADKKNLLVWKPQELAELNKDAGSYMLSEAADNSDADPGLKPDKDWFGKFANFVESEPGKLNMDSMNQIRQLLGANLQAEPGTARENWGMEYPLEAVVPGLTSSVAGKGVQVEAKFEEYHSATGAAAAGGAEAAGGAAKEYKAVEFDSFKKDAEGVKALAGLAVQVKAMMGPAGTEFLLKDAPRDNYACYKLEKVGESSGATRNYVFGYFLKGSPAHKEFEKLYKKKSELNAAGITIKGAAWYLGTETYPYPVGIIVDEVSK